MNDVEVLIFDIDVSTIYRPSNVDANIDVSFAFLLLHSLINEGSGNMNVEKD